MFTPPVTNADIALAAQHYRRGIGLGCVPVGQHVGTGKKSIVTFVMEATGWNRPAVTRRLDLAARRGLLDAPDTPPTEKPRVRVQAATDALPLDFPDRVAEAIRVRARSVEALAHNLNVRAADVNAAITTLVDAGMRIEETAGIWRVSKAPIPAAYLRGPLHTIVSEPDNTFVFGACGDQHLGSRYERLDVLEKLYDIYANEGARTVFNTGNWIDGEATFNRHDLHTHGMDQQVKYLARVYPRRDGIMTYAVAGDDHEGWYAQATGIDIGKHAARMFAEAGRSDWTDLGYMEAPVRLVNYNSGKESVLSVVHPGGGSSYALSYSIQKIIESLDGGEKPAVGLYGHYHKLWSGNIRNVWCVQTGCAQDQTPFMRKKKLEAHVGGTLCKATQDPATGAIVRFSCEIMRFFNAGYYANRWSHSGDITKGSRVSPGVTA